MICAGRARSRDLASRQDRASRMPVHIGMPASSLTSRQDGMLGKTGLKGNRYKNVLDFIITLVVVNLNSSSLTQIVN